jgi:hypothetical protein
MLLDIEGQVGLMITLSMSDFVDARNSSYLA